ncbi:hypothetical protein V462_11005 [Pantoea ananatis 15320]|uniref:hypothetical protein n=1 Tax=Pantoea ananas TaxID=553 RepID=UPI000465DB78|nr:hypothetical protein [Pantoea ananatis]PKC36124.1 hypothetical protein V462_11005 [Pantoea ananatis 15320]
MASVTVILSLGLITSCSKNVLSVRFRTFGLQTPLREPAIIYQDTSEPYQLIAPPQALKNFILRVIFSRQQPVSVFSLPVSVMQQARRVKAFVEISEIVIRHFTGPPGSEPHLTHPLILDGIRSDLMAA